MPLCSMVFRGEEGEEEETAFIDQRAVAAGKKCDIKVNSVVPRVSKHTKLSNGKSAIRMNTTDINGHRFISLPHWKADAVY